VQHQHAASGRPHLLLNLAWRHRHRTSRRRLDGGLVHLGVGPRSRGIPYLSEQLSERLQKLPAWRSRRIRARARSFAPNQQSISVRRTGLRLRRQGGARVLHGQADQERIDIVDLGHSGLSIRGYVADWETNTRARTKRIAWRRCSGDLEDHPSPDLDASVMITVRCGLAISWWLTGSLAHSLSGCRHFDHGAQRRRPACDRTVLEMGATGEVLNHYALLSRPPGDAILPILAQLLPLELMLDRARCC
jgi:hypothetical protein